MVLWKRRNVHSFDWYGCCSLFFIFYYYYTQSWRFLSRFCNCITKTNFILFFPSPFIPLYAVFHLPTSSITMNNSIVIETNFKIYSLKRVKIFLMTIEMIMCILLLTNNCPCYRLNVCIPPNSGDSIRRRGLKEVIGHEN